MNEATIQSKEIKLKQTLKKLEEENLRLREEFAARNQQLHTLNDVARALNSVLNLDVLFRLIVSLATHELEAERGSLMILEGNTLKIKSASGISQKIKDNTCIKAGEGISGKVLVNEKPILVKSEKELNSLGIKSQGKYKDCSFISVPIMIDRKCAGVVNVSGKRSGEPFDEEDLNFLETLANHAAIAIRNASIHQHAQLMAVTDGLTGLFNHRFFQERLKEEIERSRRYGQRGMCLLMIDIDDFKALNDKYGHLMGDQALKEISKILKSASRLSDVVARYGGEEFTVILPETDKEMSMAFAERLRSQVESHSFSLDNLKIKEKVTMSIGISHFPGDAGSPSQLIDRADKALYLAKQSGKNQVLLYQE